MEAPHIPTPSGHPIISAVLTIASIINAWIAWVTLKNLQIGMALVASATAMVSGIFAIRYYYYATKKAKKDAGY